MTFTRDVTYYRRRKYTSLLLALFFAIVPTLCAIFVVFPVVEAEYGLKVAITIAVVGYNSIFLLNGLFTAFKARLPLFNWAAVAFLLFICVCNTKAFQDFKTSLEIVESVALASSIIYAFFWERFLLYSAKLISAKTIKEMIE